MNRSGKYVKQVSGYRAFIPENLPLEPPLEIDKPLQIFLSSADRALAKLDGVGYTLPNPDLFIAMYVKKEALLSSQIEGTQASLEDIFAFEKGDSLENLNDVKEVVNYVNALHYGMERLEKFPMSLRLIKEIHKILLQGVRGKEKTPGEFRTSQNWIGPPGRNLNNAVFIPPPPSEVYTFMGELEKYLYSGAIYPPLIDCALIHYQFETIHPFLDGNGRLGRLMITFYLCWKEVIQKPLLYISYYFKKNRQEYYDRLMAVRENSDFKGWISFFLKGVIETADSAIEAVKDILELQARHRSLLWEQKISSPLAVGILEKLFYTPVITVRDIENNFDISFQAASNLVAQFEKAGILKEVTGKKRGKRFIYSEYVSILSEGTNL